MATNCTPVPWRVYDQPSRAGNGKTIWTLTVKPFTGSHIVCRVTTCRGREDDTPDGRGRANAELIVRAVNCHAELVAALKSAEMWMVGTRSYIDGEQHAVNAVVATRAAIKRAEE